MAETPYAPPKSKVDDVAHAPPKYWMRTKWFYLALLGFFVFMSLSLTQYLPFALFAVAVGLLLGVLISINPVQALLARRASVAPWWWNTVFWLMLGGWLLSTYIEDEFLTAMGLVAMLTLLALITLGAFFVEARYRVRAYSTTWGVGFVGEDAL